MDTRDLTTRISQLSRAKALRELAFSAFGGCDAGRLIAHNADIAVGNFKDGIKLRDELNAAIRPILDRVAGELEYKALAREKGE